MRTIQRCVFFSSLLTLAANAAAELSEMPSGKYTLDKTHAYITFSYSHLGFSNPHVGFNEFEVNLDLDSDRPEDSKLDVLIDATSIDSRVEEFDGHLKSEKYFDTANYPEITFTSTRIESTGDGTYDVTGDLTIKGVTKPVTFAATINKADMHPMRKVPTIGVSAATKVMRSDWGIDRAVPSVGNEVTIDIEVELPQQVD